MADRWIYFIKEAGNLEHMPKSLEIEPYRHAFEIANLAAMSKEEMEVFEASSIILQDENGAVEAALEKGISKGIIEGARSLLIRLIERKWGKLSSDINERLNKITSSEELEALAEKVISSTGLEDLLPD